MVGWFGDCRHNEPAVSADGSRIYRTGETITVQLTGDGFTGRVIAAEEVSNQLSDIWQNYSSTITGRLVQANHVREAEAVIPIINWHTVNATSTGSSTFDAAIDYYHDFDYYHDSISSPGRTDRERILDHEIASLYNKIIACTCHDNTCQYCRDHDYYGSGDQEVSNG